MIIGVGVMAVKEDLDNEVEETSDLESETITGWLSGRDDVEREGGFDGRSAKDDPGVLNADVSGDDNDEWEGDDVKVIIGVGVMAVKEDLDNEVETSDLESETITGWLSGRADVEREGGFDGRSVKDDPGVLNADVSGDDNDEWAGDDVKVIIGVGVMAVKEDLANEVETSDLKSETITGWLSGRADVEREGGFDGRSEKDDPGVLNANVSGDDNDEWAGDGIKV